MNYNIGDKVRFRTALTKDEQYGPWGAGEIVGLLEDNESYEVELPGLGKVKGDVIEVPETDIVGPADFEQK